MERKAVTTDGGGLVAERLQRSIIELRKVGTLRTQCTLQNPCPLLHAPAPPCRQHPFHALCMHECCPKDIQGFLITT